MSALLSPVAVQQFKDSVGFPLVGGQLYTYAAGTSTPQPSYTDATGTSANSNPIILNSRGEAPIWLTPGQFYKIVLMDASGVLIWSADQIPGGFVDASLLPDTASSNKLRADLASTTDITKGSTLISFLQAGLGAVYRILQDKMRETVSVKDFGAKGDGTTDDTAAFVAAGLVGKSLRVPDGNYNLASTPALTGVLLQMGPNGILSGAGGAALGYTTSALEQTLEIGTSSTDFATKYVRRNASHTGGTAGYVAGALKVDNYVGANPTNYEWAILGRLDNSAKAGQNVAIYGQGIKRSTGPTWGMVAEAIDATQLNDPTTGLVGIEVDCRANGTDANNNRLGIDIVCNRQNAAGSANIISYGIRIQNGGDGGSIVKTGVSLNCTAYVGFDTSASTIQQAAYKMAAGQIIAFDANSVSTLNYDGVGLSYKAGGIAKSRLNNVGGIELNGDRLIVTGSFSTGTSAPVLTANKPGTSTNVSTWLSVTIDGTQGWVPWFAN